MIAQRRTCSRPISRYYPLCFGLFLLLSVLSTSLRAQITLDGSLGGPSGALSGPQYVIPADVGQIRGVNLFHSFGQFNVFNGESATFTGPNSIHNILSRVTGGNPSWIDGLLRSDIFGANLFLLNPSGVLFGPNARLDISGSFHVSTADYLRLADGAVFSSHTSRPSVLSTAPPEAFGFLGPSPALIGVFGSSLHVPQGETIALVGGEIVVTGDATLTAVGVPTLGAPGGHIHIASVASAGEVRVDPASQAALGPFAGLGRITIANVALLSVSGERAGTVVIRGGSLLLHKAFVVAETRGHGAGLGIDIAVTGEAVITNGAAVVTSALGMGRGGDIRITAGSVEVSNVSLVSTRAFPGSTGDSGHVTITAASMQVRDGALVSTVTAGMGQGGNVVLAVRNLGIIGGGQVFSGTLGSGAGGNITIHASDTVIIAGRDLAGTQSVLNTTTTGGSGAAGRITLTASTLVLNDGGIQTYTDTIGRGGDVWIQTGRLTLVNSAQINSFSLGAGSGGMITLQATEAALERSGVMVLTKGGTGHAGDITISAKHLTLNNSSILATTERGDAGTVTITASSLSLESGLIRSSTIGDRPAGNVLVNVGRLTLTKGSGLLSTSGLVDAAGNVIAGTGASGAVTIFATEAVSLFEGSVISTSTGGGPGGPVLITAPNLVVDGSAIQAATVGNSRAGDVVVRANHVTLTGGAEIGSDSGIPNLTGGLTVGSGQAGNVTIAAATIELKDGIIRTTTGGDGDAGNIMIETGRLTLTNRSQILSASGVDVSGRLFVGMGPAGTVTVSATDTVLIAEGSVISTLTSGGKGGRVSITAPNLYIDGGGINASTLGDNRAGDIVVNVGNMALLGGAQLLSTSGFIGPDGSVIRASGAAGTITVSATDTVLISGVSSRGFSSGVFVLTVDGPGGKISIFAPGVIIQGGLIQASTAGNGAAGSIVVETGRLTLTDGALLVSTSGVAGPAGTIIVGTGAAGNVTVSATESVSLTNASGMLVTTAGGQGGQVSITAPILTLSGGSEIVASTAGDSSAGDIVVDVGRLILAGGRLFSTSGVPDFGGHLRVGTGAAGNVTVSATEMISLSDVSSISVTTAGGQGGQISIRTPTLTLTGSSEIAANTAGDSRGGDIIVNVGYLSISEGSGFFSTSGALDPCGNVVIGKGAAGTVTISALVIDMDRGIIQTSTSGDGRAGDIAIHTERLTLTGHARILSQSGIIGPSGNLFVGQGAAGAITISADSLSISDFGTISSDTFGRGDAGAITVSARTLHMENEALIEARTIGDGNAGDVQVTVGRLILSGGAQIGSTSGIATAEGDVIVGTGSGGRVIVTATDEIYITGRNNTGVVASGIFSETGGTGHAGLVIVSTPRLIMQDGGRISTNTGGDGNAGDILVQVGSASLTGGAQITSASGINVGDLFFVGAGAGGTVRLTATDTVQITGHNSGLATNTAGQGRGGNIVVQARQVQLMDGASLTATGTTTGAAGNIVLTVEETLQSMDSTVTTTAHEGRGGVIALTAGMAITLMATDIAATVTGGSQPGGSITLTTPSLTITGSRLAAETRGAGKAGDITLQVGDLSAQDTRLTSSSTQGATGDAGTITVQGLTTTTPRAQTVRLTRSVLATEADVADGGDIFLLADGRVWLVDSAITTAVHSGVGQGGNILIDPQFVILERSQVLADAFGGPGGNIWIVADGFVADATSRVSASSAQNVAGTITIEGFTNLSGLVAPVTPDFASVLTLLRDRCAARLHEGSVSTLVERGRDGVPASPDDLLPSRFFPAGMEGMPPSDAGRFSRARYVTAPEDFSDAADRQFQIRGWPTAVLAVSSQLLACPPH